MYRLVAAPADVTANELRRAVDTVQVAEVLKRVARAADVGSLEEYAALLTADMVWEMPANPATGLPAQTRRGRDDVMAGVVERRSSGGQGPGSATRHVVDTVSVDSGGDGATALSSWQFYADTSSSPRLVSMGTYRDELRRADGSWQLSVRRISLG